jgi:5-methylcytosine-specific restriction endonuclease McrA
MDAATRALVRSRAGGSCEYCQSHQGDEPIFRYQIEHILPKQHGGTDDDVNLALACPHCNQHKGTNLAGLDPIDDSLTPLFNPRAQRWEDHFAHRGPVIMGQSAVGRTTVRVLHMNDELRVRHRATLGH